MIRYRYISPKIATSLRVPCPIITLSEHIPLPVYPPHAALAWYLSGWGPVLNQFPPFAVVVFILSKLLKHCSVDKYHVQIWQVAPQPSCGATCQIWTWFKRSGKYICKFKNVRTGEINEQHFSNPHSGQSIFEGSFCNIYAWRHMNALA